MRSGKDDLSCSDRLENQIWFVDGIEFQNRTSAALYVAQELGCGLATAEYIIRHLRRV